MIIKYTDLNGVETINGSQIKIIDSKGSGNIYTYSCISMTIQFFIETIVISGVREINPVDSDKTYKESFELYVTNSSIRRMSDLAVALPSEALNIDGSLKSGYKREFDFFVELFGHNNFGMVTAMYPFIIDAIQRKYNLT